MIKRNQDIRDAAKCAGVYLWEIAEVINLNDGSFSRRLRRELSDEDKKKIFIIIDDLKSKRNRR